MPVKLSSTLCFSEYSISGSVSAKCRLYVYSVCILCLKSVACILYPVCSLHFVPGLQSAVCILYPFWSLQPAFCTWSAVCSLHFVPSLQSAFYSQSAVCSLHFVLGLRSAACILYPVCNKKKRFFACNTENACQSFCFRLGIRALMKKEISMKRQICC